MFKRRLSWDRAWSVLLVAVATACSGVDDDAGGRTPGSAESATGIEGEVSVHVATYEDGTTETLYMLETADGQSVELVFSEDPALEPGDVLRAAGTMDDTDDRPRMLVSSFERIVPEGDIGERQDALIQATPRPDYTVAMLMVRWGSPDSQTVSGMRQKVFTGTTSTNEYFRETSYGISGLSGNVFGWFTIPNPGGCNYTTIASSARSAATAAGVNLSNYRQIMYYFPRTSQCGWSGLGSVGSPTSPARDSWYNGSSGCVVLAQELAHNYGLMHSRSCSSLPAGALCSSFSEYGDPFCPMGSGCWQMNAVQKGEMGWFGGCNIVTANATGEFVVAPLELPSNNIQALRVPRGNGRYYYIENRMELGKFDTRRTSSTLNTVFDGVLIHEGPEVQPFPSRNNRYPYLLDMNTNTSTFQDAALPVGRTYTSPEGIRITLLSKSSTGATVRVERPGGSGAATCMDGSTYGAAPPPPPPTSGCAAGEVEWGGHCYYLTTTARTYDQASNECKARGTGWRLAVIGSSSENAFVSSLIGNGEYWLDGTDRVTEGEWFWTSINSKFWTGGLNGGPVGSAYTNFLSDEPNDAPGTNADCLRMIAGGGWRDIGCGYTYRGVCESS
jgi:hypothetical protein